MAPPPVSAPPWGMTAPPWGSMAPPQPLAAPVDDAEAEPDDADDEDEGTDEPAYVDLDLDQPRLEPAPEPPADATSADAPVSAYPQQPAYPSTLPAYAIEEPESGGRSRATVIVAVVATVVAVAAVAGVGALVLGRDAAPPAGPTPSASAPATATGPPPTDLKLRDDTATITLTWTDPADGAVPFMVAGGRTGQALGVMASVDPGQTTYTVNGLNSRVDYCFTVLAVYSTDSFATSGQVCTDRKGGASPR